MALSLTALVATCVVREDNDLSPLLRWRPVAWVGTISYGIYLMHPLCIAVGRSLLGAAGAHRPVAVFLIALILSVAAASLSFVTFERRFLRLKDRVFPDRSKSHADPVRRPVAGARVAAVSLQSYAAAISNGRTPDR